jgi:SAM-dependent methyltransferase
MAKIEFIQNKDGDQPESVECVEVRPWGPGGKPHQQFVIGSGANFDAANNIVLEIIYAVNGIQFFYTRNYLSSLSGWDTVSDSQALADKFKQGEFDTWGFGDMLPETSIYLKREKYTRQNKQGDDETVSNYHLEIGIDVGAVVGHASPGMRMIDIRLTFISMEAGVQFMQDLTRELLEAYQGKRPNPADLPDGAGEWPFIRQLNQKAYDIISDDYQEEYFSNPLLTEMFDAWLAELPSGAKVLDAGCGHGDPVIARLLEKGLQVTGSDLSPRMLARAQEKFPTVTLVNQTVSEIRYEAEFDAACSLSSLLYLDPIDLSHSIFRLYRALKPGGLLFLHAHDLHPSWRGLPYGVDIKQWMWSWSYGLEEAAHALEEFGYFKMLRVTDVSTEQQKKERIERWRTSMLENHQRLVETMPEGSKLSQPDLSRVPQNLPYGYALIARREK